MLRHSPSTQASSTPDSRAVPHSLAIHDIAASRWLDWANAKLRARRKNTSKNKAFDAFKSAQFDSLKQQFPHMNYRQRIQHLRTQWKKMDP